MALSESRSEVVDDAGAIVRSGWWLEATSDWNV